MLSGGIAHAQTTDKTAICKQYGPDFTYNAERGTCVKAVPVNGTNADTTPLATPATADTQTSNVPVSGANSNTPSTASTPTNSSGGKLTYTPLEPLPNDKCGGNTTNCTTYNSLSAYLNLMFNILLSIGAMFAVITLVLGGITIMISEVVDKRTAARRRIQAAFIGLGLLLTCWLILNTINPDLTKFSLLGLDQAVAGASGSSSSSGSSKVPTGAQAQQLQVACRAQGSQCALNPAPGGGFSCDCAPAL